MAGLTEYNHLKQKFQHLECQSGPLRVLRPIDFYSYRDFKALLMDYVGGENFHNVLLPHTRRNSKQVKLTMLAESAQRCGQRQRNSFWKDTI